MKTRLKMCLQKCVSVSLALMKAFVLKHVCKIKNRFLPASRFFHSLYSTSAAGFVYVFYENAKAALFHTIKVGKSSFRKDKKQKTAE